MKRSTDRILTTHAGALPRADDLKKMIFARADGEPYDKEILRRRLREGVAEVVREQITYGVDIVNDGELGKTNFTNYVRERLGGLETRQARPDDPPRHNISARDMQRYPEYFAKTDGGFAWRGYTRPTTICVAPLEYVGHAELQEDLDNFKAALAGVAVEGSFLNANTPGTIEHWLRNQHYPTQEAFLYAIADVMSVEYEAIAKAGFLLQIDDPDLPDAWQMYPDMTVAEYRKYADLRADALNHALRNVPTESIQLHVCWGSFHGPHQNDIPLEHIIDIIFKVRASSYSIEASNPVHEHEWSIFETAKLPDGAILIPGVAGHATDFIEHPKLIAQRLERYANLVGRERVMAGTDCGLGPRVGHPKIAWGKLEAMAAGAKLATEHLWKK